MSLNLYTYVKNNPLKYVDPSGHRPAYGAFDEYDPNLTYQGVMLDANGYYTGESTGSYHDLLDLVGLIPVIGEFADGANAIAYLIEGERAYALLSSMSLVPILGWSATATKVTLTAGEAVADAGKILDKASVFKSACNCFVGGTKVQTNDGEKNIEDIEVGDMVLAKDQNDPDGELAYKEVKNLYRNKRDDIIKLYVGEQAIETTDNHPFWVVGKGWVFADELQVGDSLQKADGSNLTIDKVEFVKLDEPVTVYNFTVADFHTYYVTGLGIWVHNTKCGYTSIKGNNFNKSYDNLSKNIQEKADAAFKQFQENPDHPSLNFEYLNGAPKGSKYVSARVDGSYRAYGIIRENGVIEWVGVNNHDYKAVIRELNSAN